MEWDILLLALGIAAAGYCIGDGLRNFQNPGSKNVFDALDEEDEHELIQEKDVHHFMGLTKEDAKHLLKEHKNIPHIIVNDNVYYPKAKLHRWLMELGD